jgi:putative FmdB family regulatory protein
MPTYQYACVNADCGSEFELVQSFTDPAASQCPVCEGSVRKVFSAVGVVFKGSGFYRNDSRNGADKSNGKSAAKTTGTDSKSTSDSISSSSSTSSTSSSDSSSSSSSSSSSTSSGNGAPTKAAASA